MKNKFTKEQIERIKHKFAKMPKDKKDKIKQIIGELRAITKPWTNDK